MDELSVAISEASKRKEAKFLPYLVRLYGHKHVVVRAHVIKALSSEFFASKQESANVLAEALSDQEYLVRGFAAKGAISFKNPPMAKKLLNELKLREKKEKNSRVLKLIKKSIAKIG